MNERATGLILRIHPLTETSLIVHWLTEAHGRLATVAKGARRPKSPFRGKLDVFYHAEFSFGRSRRSDLHQLREARLLNPHGILRQDLARLRQVAYAAALIEQNTETETPLPGALALLGGFLNHMDHHPARPQYVFALEMKWLDELGLAPNLKESHPLTPGTRQILEPLARQDWAGVAALPLSPAQAAEMRQFLHGFLIYHLGRIPAGRIPAIELA